MNPVSSPYLHQSNSIARVMRQVCVALLPGIFVFIWQIGLALLVQILVASVAALVFEALALRLRGRPVRPFVTDGSALVTAWLVALTFPPLSPWWLTVTGVFLAIVIAKQVYGGLGQNPFNPAMVAFAGCIVAFPAFMSQWPSLGLSLSLAEQIEIIFGFSPRLDALSGATPLSAIKATLKMESFYASIQELLGSQNLFGMFAGRGWEWVSTAYLAGGLFLLYRRVITWHVPVAFLLTLSLLACVFWVHDPSRFASPLFHLFSGGVMLGAFFIATDPVSGCATPRGKLFFGCGVGVLAYLIRVFGVFPDGIAFAVLLMNIAAPMLDRHSQPAVFGTRGASREEKP
ncbi:MAG: RnfABCDGE type electron transport complex subunit D [Zoogloeaceae bacterium]|jgi:electron transport complex protein RnfD|nr:RnfABCDGE type electron transport complex subunit D [Zoogloeaceae bacterium]